jgi:hypothetical protein
MDKNAETLQSKLEELESGKPILESLDGLTETEAKLLQLASELREFKPPTRNPASVAKQLATMKQVTEKETSQNMLSKIASFFQGNAWLKPAMAVTMLVLFGCFVFAGLGLGGFTIFRLDRLDNDSARVREIQGIFEYQAKDGAWQVVKENDRLSPGTRVRTGELSSALLKLQDGSIVRLGSSTEVTLDQMDRFLFGTRIVRITQWVGETSHEVESNRKASSLYEVRTPASTVTAKGTAFTVQVQADLMTWVDVTEGAVDVTGAEATVLLETGQTTSVAVKQQPEEPAFLVSGEGILTISGKRWTVTGERITLDETTLVNGDPQTGDMVSFEGRQLSDGTLLVHRVDRLNLPETTTFTFSGTMEDIADTGVVVESRYIGTDQGTSVDADVESGEVVLVRGVIESDGSWLATHVYASTTEQPFQFVGVLESQDDDLWVVSGLEIHVDENTLIGTNILTGDIVEVTGWVQENGDWLAGSIQPILAAEARFDFTGTVDEIDPWVISGRTIVVRAWTSIDEGIEPGDLVHAQGPVLEDGTWVAASITLVEETPEPENVTLEFTGIVNSTNPWVISGIQLVVDGDTQFSGEITTGALVKVRATLQSNGVWHADDITLIVSDSMGCVTFASVVTAIEGDTITLQNGMSINLLEVEEVDGVIEVESVILVTRCLALDGTVTMPLIQVLSNPPDEPTPPPTTTPTFTSTPAPVSVILPNCYKITFLGFTDNGDGTSTWSYRVEELSCAQDLSNWMLELPACTTVVGAAPSPWEVVQPDPNHHLNGIKWQTGAGFQSGDFSVTLTGDLTTGTVQVGAKGPDVAIESITGPACDVPTTGTPTITITPTVTPTIDLTASPTSSPTDVPPTVPPQLPTQAPPPPSSGTILITDNAQILTFTCNGNTVEVRGNSNTITLLGSCGSITVKGNANVIYYSGSPVITDTGNGNTLLQR